MKKSESFRSKYKLYIIYTIFMIFFWLWQVIDWWIIRAWNDPIWHALFYLALMPLVSFIFWILIWNTSKWWIFPFYVLVATLFVFIFFANWWLKIVMNFGDLLWYGFIYIIFPSFWASIIWVLITKVVLLIWKLFKHKM